MTIGTYGFIFSAVLQVQKVLRGFTATPLESSERVMATTQGTKPSPPSSIFI